ncbi:MAG TPA: TetR/AcrR family transcriptional regulator [Mollicutes bacterium]|nr:TetR/AcrR family transcriptional regulator [Mollicutes bacterium]
MVKQTFLNLSVEKQNKILTAAKEEFARASLKDASVANIIKKAGIPRGSFYQYFNDLEGIFYYLLEEHSKDVKKRLVDNLVKYKGDVTKSFIDLYQYILKKISKEENEAYFKNIFLNMDYKIEKMFLPNLEDNLNEIIQLIDITKLNIESRLQLIYVLEIIESVMMRNLIQVFQRSVSKEKNIEIFIKEMLLINSGIYKKGDN